MILFFSLLVIIGIRYIKKKHKKEPFVLLFIHGISQQKIVPYFQPIVDSRTGKCIGAEVLARWNVGDELLSPNWFIPQIESLGLEHEFTAYMISSALKEVSNFLCNRPELYISFNLSADTLNQPYFLTWLEKERIKFGVLPTQIRLELTERQPIKYDKSKCILKEYRDVGYSVYIDDFGTGYSNLSYLQYLSVDALKIDKVFIDALTPSNATPPILQHIIRIGRELNLQLIAEGVEYEYQKEHLKNLGVFIIQGWTYSPSLTSDDWKKYCQ